MKDLELIIRDLTERRDQLARLWQFEGFDRDKALKYWGINSGPSISSPLHLIHYGQYELLNALIVDYETLRHGRNK